jgi:hypothetical protein
MKLSFQRFEQSQQALASVPLYPVAKWNAKDDEETTFRSVKLDLKTNPTSADSPKFSSYFKVFENGTPEQWCRWRDDLSTVFKGLNLVTGPNQFGMVHHLLGGQARDTFNEFFSKPNTPQNEANLELGLKKVAATIFTDNAASNQKQYMRHELRKPNKLTARETSTRLVQLNTWLSYYPLKGENVLTKLDETELREIYFRLLPTTWRRKMDENVNFDRSTQGLRGLVDYAERLETSEARFDGKPKENVPNKEKSQDGSKTAERHAKKGKSETGGAAHHGNGAHSNWTKDCLVHGVACGHPSHKCKVLLDHAEKVKGQFKASFKDKTVHKKSSASKPWKLKPNTWRKDENKERSYTRKEVQMLLKKCNSRTTSKKEEEDSDLDLNQMDEFELDPKETEELEDMDSLLEELHIE